MCTIHAVGTFYYPLDVAEIAEMAAIIGEDAIANNFRKQFENLFRAVSGRHEVQRPGKAHREHQHVWESPYDRHSRFTEVITGPRRKRTRGHYLLSSLAKDRSIVAIRGEQRSNDALESLEFVGSKRHVWKQTELAELLGPWFLRRLDVSGHPGSNA